MSYCKFVVDNPTCSRRFHLAFDDQDERVTQTNVSCGFCGKTIYTASDHPPVKTLRQENLVNTSTLSEYIVQGCDFVDDFSVKTIPNATRDQYKLYK